MWVGLRKALIETCLRPRELWGHARLLPDVALIERQRGIPAEVELVYGAAALAGNKEADDFCNLFRLEKFVRLYVGAHSGNHLGGDTAGRDQVYADAKGLHLFGEHFCEAGESVLAGRVNRLVDISFEAHN